MGGLFSIFLLRGTLSVILSNHRDSGTVVVLVVVWIADGSRDFG